MLDGGERLTAAFDELCIMVRPGQCAAAQNKPCSFVKVSPTWYRDIKPDKAEGATPWWCAPDLALVRKA